MKIGIDIDDTMTFIKEDLEHAAIDFDKSLGNSGEFLYDSYYVGKKFNWSKEDYRYFMGTIRKNVVNNAKLRNGLIEVLHKLREEGHKIIIITARSNIYYSNPLKMTIEWLKKENIPYDKLILPSRNKKKDCEKEQIDIFIDDDINNCLKVNELGIKVLIMDNIDNYLDNNSITRVNDFYEVYDEVKKYQKSYF